MSQKRDVFHKKLRQIVGESLTEGFSFRFKEVDGKYYYCFQKSGHEDVVLPVEEEPNGIYVILHPQFITLKDKLN